MMNVEYLEDRDRVKVRGLDFEVDLNRVEVFDLASQLNAVIEGWGHEYSAKVGMGLEGGHLIIRDDHGSVVGEGITCADVRCRGCGKG